MPPQTLHERSVCMTWVYCAITRANVNTFLYNLDFLTIHPNTQKHLALCKGIVKIHFV